MIHGAVKRRRIAQEVGVVRIEVAHLLEDFNALRSVQDFEEHARAAQPQVQQGEIDVVVAAGGGLQRVLLAVLPLDAEPHLAEIYP